MSAFQEFVCYAVGRVPCYSVQHATRVRSTNNGYEALENRELTFSRRSKRSDFLEDLFNFLVEIHYLFIYSLVHSCILSTFQIYVEIFWVSFMFPACFRFQRCDNEQDTGQKLCLNDTYTIAGEDNWLSC